MASVTCLFAAEFNLKRGEICQFHRHPCTEIVFYWRCAGWLLAGPKRFRYQDGDFSIYQPRFEHSDHCAKAGVQLAIGVAGCGAETLSPGLWRAGSGVRAIAEHFHRELRHGDSFHQATLDLLAGWVALEIQRQLAAQRPQGLKAAAATRAEAAKAIFDTRFSESLTLRDVARELYIHPDYLRQLFRKEIGEAPLHYLLRRRVESACELLHWTDSPVKEIAARVGIPNPYYFSRLFHRWVGCTPSEHRARHRIHPLRQRSGCEIHSIGKRTINGKAGEGGEWERGT